MATPRPRWILALTCLVYMVATSLVAAENTQRTREEMKASLNAHKSDFDYLLGDWEFTSFNKQYGKGHGYWTAVEVGDGQVFDEFRVVGDKGEVYYSTVTLRSYNAMKDQWELVSGETGSGLQNVGTGRREGAEVHIEQMFGSASDNPHLLRIRYYDIGPDHFSWIADASSDGGKSWAKEVQRIEARRIGPRHTGSPFAPQKK